MDKQYFVLDFAHSLHGRVKRVQVSYRCLAYTAAAFLVAGMLVFGLLFSYLWMGRRVSKYEQLRADFDHLRTRYVDLQRQSNQHEQQIASLETLASEVSVAYGINQPGMVGDGAPLDSDSVPNLEESIEQYNFLQSASYSSIYHHYAYRWQAHNEPSLWPVIGIVRSTFGSRSDPFSGEGAFHAGIDLQAPVGTPVHATADGVIERAGWSSTYGKVIVINHGNGLETYYAHLSKMRVLPGEEVRRGEVIALSGCTGRATGPHVHYEVRLRGTPVNPYRYLAKSANSHHSVAVASDIDLGL